MLTKLKETHPQNYFEDVTMANKFKV